LHLAKTKMHYLQGGQWGKKKSQYGILSHSSLYFAPFCLRPTPVLGSPPPNPARGVGGGRCQPPACLANKRFLVQSIRVENHAPRDPCRPCDTTVWYFSAKNYQYGFESGKVPVCHTILLPADYLIQPYSYVCTAAV